MSKKNTVIFYKEWLPLINSLSDEKRLNFYDSIFCEKNIDEISDPHLRSILDFVSQKISQNEEKYFEEIEKRRAAGKISGEIRRAKRTHVQSVQHNSTNSTHVQSVEHKKTCRTHRSDNVNVNDNVSDNVNVISSLRSEIEISDDLWKSFLEHRKKLKSPMTQSTEQLMLKKLKKWKQEGFNPQEIIETMLERGWKSWNPEWVQKDHKNAEPKHLHNNFEKQDYSKALEGFEHD